MIFADDCQIGTGSRRDAVDQTVLLVVANPVVGVEFRCELVAAQATEPQAFALSRVGAHVVVGGVLALLLALVLLCAPSAEGVVTACCGVATVEDVAVRTAVHVLPIPGAATVGSRRTFISFARFKSCE